MNNVSQDKIDDVARRRAWLPVTLLITLGLALVVYGGLWLLAVMINDAIAPFVVS
jgi:hypothetical protein